MDKFSLFANSYGKYNVIQKKIIKKYINLLENRVIDLGCGSEGLCKYKKFDFYLGIDKSQEMLKLNPCNTLELDFDTKECFERIKSFDFNQIVSFSALQWSKNLKFVLEKIAKLNKNYLLAIFTSNTFKKLHTYLNYQSPIYSKEEIIKFSKVLNPKIEILNYKLTFSSPIKMLEYIKYSGVSGEKKANISKLKRFIKEFPFNDLEFEIIILKP